MIIPEIKDGSYVFRLSKDVNFSSLTLSCHPVIVDIINGVFLLHLPLREITTIHYDDGLTLANTGSKDPLLTDKPERVYSVYIPAPSNTGATIIINTTGICGPIWLS
jgi:hypothetical protein